MPRWLSAPAGKTTTDVMLGLAPRPGFELCFLFL